MISSLLLPLLLLLLLLSPPTSSLTPDGTLLLSFKYSVLNDPYSSLSNWNYDDPTPCSWNGVICTAFPNDTTSRVISLILPDARLLGSVPSDLALIPHLRHLDLSANFLNGTLPASLSNATALTVLSLANNDLSGDLSALSALSALQVLNLSDNAFAGRIPPELAALPNLTTLSLSNNYLSGPLPGGGFERLQVLDLSSNLINGTIPADFGVGRLQYLNLSYNKVGGEIPAEVGSGIPAGATCDLSFNNLTGGIPQSAAFLAQKPVAFAGNPELCGKPLRNLCSIPSTLSNPPPNVSSLNPPESPPAFAAIPKSTTENGSSSGGGGGGGFKPVTIAAIVIGDLGGIGLLFVLFLYAYQVKKRKREEAGRGFGVKKEQKPCASPELRGSVGLACCLRKKEEVEGETSEETSSSSDTEIEEKMKGGKEGAMLVMVDGGNQLEMETLLKASAFILGAAGPTIVYKAVLADGTALAVRRIGEGSSIEKFKDFEAQVKSIAKFRHNNLLRIWGFYWGPDEKLLIHDFATNGSLANISFSKKLGSSPFHLSWENRLRIARGVARGLAYIHEKKSVHGNIKPSNILLGSDMEARIGDFGLDRLLFGDSALKSGASARLFGSKRSVQSQGSVTELSPLPVASPLGSNSIAGPSSVPYQAPESLKNLRPNAKWDVYSFGMILLELVSGRVFTEGELSQWNSGYVVEERNRIIRMADPSLRGEIEGKEEAFLSCFKLGVACSSIAPQRRPSMKDVVMLLDRIPFSA